MIEKYQGRAENVVGPATRGFAIAPSDSADLTAETRAIYVGGGGDLTLVLSSGDEIELVGVAEGATLPLRIRRVKGTGTTATHLVGLY